MSFSTSSKETPPWRCTSRSPIEISTRMRPGEWTDATLDGIWWRATGPGSWPWVRQLQEVVEEIEKNDDGSVEVSLSRGLSQIFAEDAGFTENCGQP